MGLRDEVRDPWAGVVAGVAGGLSWAVSSDLTAGVAVGAAVYAVKALTGLVVGRRGGAATGREQQFPRPRRGSPAAYWLDRAEAAVRSLRELAGSLPPGPTWTAVHDVGEESATTLDALRRLAGQIGAVEAALARVDLTALSRDRARLEAQLPAAPSGEVREEVGRALATVREQAGVVGRLQAARETLLARMQAAAFGLEGLVARLAEVLALSATSGGVDVTSQQIGDLAGELDGLRAGLAETEALSRQALQAAGPDRRTA